jgi:hypothetical protein
LRGHYCFYQFALAIPSLCRGTPACTLCNNQNCTSSSTILQLILLSGLHPRWSIFPMFYTCRMTMRLMYGPCPNALACICGTLFWSRSLQV